MAVIPNDVNVKDFIEPYVTFDKPIPYKDLYIYPIMMEDIFKFESSVGILNIEKNKIPDIQVIQMSYLQFLLEIILGDKANNQKAVEILSLCFGLKETEIYEGFPKNELLFQKLDDGSIVFFENGWNIKFVRDSKNKVTLYIDEVEINSQEFDEIRKIIMFQNIIGYDDEYVSDDVKKVIDDYYAIKNKGLVNPSIEDKMSALTAMIGITKNQIIKMTYREFENTFKFAMDKNEYQIGRTAELSGNVKFDKPVDHWVYKRKKNRYADIFGSVESVTDKITKLNG